MHERKGEYFRRYEFLDGRVREEKLSEVTGVEVPFRHYEIFTEYAIQRSGLRTGQRILMGDSKNTPALLGAKAAAVRAGAHILSSVEDIFNNGQALGASGNTEPSLLTLIVSNRTEIPKIINAIKVQQLSARAGKEVKIERILLVEEGKDIKGTEPLLAENIVIEDAVALLLEEAQEIAAPIALMNHPQLSEPADILRHESFLSEYRQQITLSEILNQVGEPLSLGSFDTVIGQESSRLVPPVRESQMESVSEGLDLRENVDPIVSQPVPVMEKHTDQIPEFLSYPGAEPLAAVLSTKYQQTIDSDTLPPSDIPERKLAIELNALISERLTGFAEILPSETPFTITQPTATLLSETPEVTQTYIEIPRNEETVPALKTDLEPGDLQERSYNQENEAIANEPLLENTLNTPPPNQTVPFQSYENLNLAEYHFSPFRRPEGAPAGAFESYLVDFKNSATSVRENV